MIKKYNELDKNKFYLITGSAGFIGFFLSQRLLKHGCRVIGIDNLNDYYDVNLKFERLRLLQEYANYIFVKGDIGDKESVANIFKQYKPQIVVNLAAQAGVRYSQENPDLFIQSNIVGFHNILEACRYNPVEHLLYASSSSVYGANKIAPFSTEDRVDTPVSLYAATKKSNELMAHVYSQLYGIPSTGLRFFTVYGPLGRPDMAYFSFTKKIFKGEPIQIFNSGDCYRDFTYIDDTIESITRILCNPPAKREDQDSILNGIRYALYNIGNNKPQHLMYYITVLEKALGKAVRREITAKKVFHPMQPGDIQLTYSNSTPLERDFEFKPSTSIEEGLQRFADWYVSFYQIR